MGNATRIDDLISRVALGDRKAFSALYDATSGKLLGICLRVLKNRALAEDALQETYMKVWRYADRYAAQGQSPMSWLIAIARNTAIDKLRAEKPTEDVTEMSDVLPASDPNGEQCALAQDEAGRIATCLSTLDDPRDKAVRSAYLEGLSYAEIAETFSVPLNTVRTWLRRSLISLRECMGG